MSYLDPFLAAGIGTQVMPSVYVITTENVLALIGPGYFAKVNDPACKVLASVYPDGLKVASPSKAVVVARAATRDDVLSYGKVATYPTTPYYQQQFLEGWLKANAAAYGTTPQAVRAAIEKNVKCY